QLAEVPGMCGAVHGGIFEGFWGFEAGQSGVCDIVAWFGENQVRGESARAAAEAGQGLHEYITERAAQQEVGQQGLNAHVWHSGDRSTHVDHELPGLLIGQTLTTQPADIYRALLESTAFGTRVIIEAFEAAGVPVTEFVVAGGLLKNSFLMQMYADVTRLPLSTIASSQGPALGRAI